MDNRHLKNRFSSYQYVKDHFCGKAAIVSRGQTNDLCPRGGVLLYYSLSVFNSTRDIGPLHRLLGLYSLSILIRSLLSSGNSVYSVNCVNSE